MYSLPPTHPNFLTTTKNATDSSVYVLFIKVKQVYDVYQLTKRLSVIINGEIFNLYFV